MEIWKDIKGFENKYQISNLGNVKSIMYNHTTNQKLLKKVKMKIGYENVTFYTNGKPKTYYVHRLVGEHFIENYNNLPTINHKNAIKTDNRVENLEWCSFKDNNKHARDMGINKPVQGEKHGKSKLKESDIYFILNSKLSYRKLGEIYNVSKTSIEYIKKGKNWKHITKNIL